MGMRELSWMLAYMLLPSSPYSRPECHILIMGFFRVCFCKFYFFLAWIQLNFSTDFVGYKLPLHPLVSKQTWLDSAALGLSCSQSRVNRWRKRKFVTKKISAKIKLNPSPEKAKLPKAYPKYPMLGALILRCNFQINVSRRFWTGWMVTLYK